MFGYREGVPGGSDLEKLVKHYKTSRVSHLFEFAIKNTLMGFCFVLMIIQKHEPDL